MTTITSPGGDLIEVVDDADFMEVFDLSIQDMRLWAPKKPIFAALWHEGAVIDRQSGRASLMLWERARRYGYPSKHSAIHSVLNSPLSRACIDRDINNKRTYSIRLVRLPVSFVERLQQTKAPPRPKEGRPVVEPGPRPESGPERVEVLESTVTQPPTVEPPSDITEDAAAVVARHLLAEVVRIVSSEEPADDAALRAVSVELTDTRQKLAAALEYGQKMRRERDITGEELLAARTERDGLRQRLRTTEANLSAALGGEGRRFIDAEVRKQLGRIMEARPTGKGDDDA